MLRRLCNIRGYVGILGRCSIFSLIELGLPWAGARPYMSMLHETRPRTGKQTNLLDHGLYGSKHEYIGVYFSEEADDTVSLAVSLDISLSLT